MEMELKKMPKRKPPPQPSPRTAQSPDAAALMARLSPGFNPLALLGAAPMVVPPKPRGKKGRGKRPRVGPQSHPSHEAKDV
jgi:hypothetical protein